MRGWTSVAAFMACAVAAFAAAYDDFMLGDRAYAAGNYDLAITAFTNALNATDLPPAYRPTALVGRGTALARKGRCTEALADANEAVKLSPAAFPAHLLRVQMDVCLGNDDAAYADAAAALAMHKDAGVYVMRAAVHWRHDDFAGAAADFDAASDQQPRDGVLALWSAVAHMKAGSLDERAFGDKVWRLDSGQWPAAIIAFYRGAGKLDDVRKAQNADNPSVVALRKCQADFFIGEWLLYKGDKPGAKELIGAAASECPKNSSLVGQIARMEFKRF